MKVKNWIIIAMSALVASSLSYAEPADESKAAAPQENIGAISGNATNAGASGMDLSSNTVSPMVPSELGSSNDDITADTATGDDDY